MKKGWLALASFILIFALLALSVLFNPTANGAGQTINYCEIKKIDDFLPAITAGNFWRNNLFKGRRYV